MSGYNDWYNWRRGTNQYEYDDRGEGAARGGMLYDYYSKTKAKLLLCLIALTESFITIHIKNFQLIKYASHMSFQFHNQITIFYHKVSVHFF